MTINVYSNKNYNKNELQNAVAHPVTSFPDGAREGQLIYHSTLKAFFVCINENMTGGTSQKGAWGLGSVDISELTHLDDPNKVLVTSEVGTIITSDVDGGNFS